MTAVVSRERAKATCLTGAAGVLLLAVAFVMMVVAAPGHAHDPAKPGTLAEARQAGVQQVALLSGSSAASGDMSNAISRYMIESETEVSNPAWPGRRPGAHPG